MRWGIAPAWWRKSLSELPAMFNARAETVSTKPMFPSAFKSRRCFIPASCFFECTGKPSAKVPHYFSAPAGRISETLPAPAEEEVGGQLS